MNREEFNKLSVEDQIAYFRAELSNGNNFNAICKSIGISKNTIKPRFLNAGYIEVYKGSTKIVIDYIKEGEEVNLINLTSNDPVEVKAPIKKIEKNKKDNRSSKELDTIVKRLEVLEQEVKALKEVEKENLNENFIISDFSGKTITKTFKIDVDVYEELEKIINKFSMYKKQDIISSLLKLALNNINNIE